MKKLLILIAAALIFMVACDVLDHDPYKNEELENFFGDLFVEFKEMLESLADTKIHFNARPGISYSMRGEKTSQTERPLFVMVDVIDDDPSDRWLSVCFYGDNITDPDELGDFVPGGLLGKDGHCFDLDEREMGKYLATRITEAHANQ